MKLKLSSGLYYGEGPDGKQVCRGARMGRPNKLPDDPKAPIKLRLERLEWVDGDYDQGGAYWGYMPGECIYCAWNPGTEIQVFTRNSSRYLAKLFVKHHLPNATFYR